MFSEGLAAFIAANIPAEIEVAYAQVKAWVEEAGALGALGVMLPITVSWETAVGEGRIVFSPRLSGVTRLSVGGTEEPLDRGLLRYLRMEPVSVPCEVVTLPTPGWVEASAGPGEYAEVATTYCLREEVSGLAAGFAEELQMLLAAA